MKATLPSAFLFGMFLLLFSCQKKEQFAIASFKEYYPLQVGKFITYRLDSLVFTRQGRTQETHVYQEKNVVDAEITDAMGRPSFRIYRFLRDSAGNQPWRSAGTFFATPTETTLEIVDDNMRVVRLISPFKKGQSWKGNRFLAPEPYASLYQFGNDDDMGQWDFTITEMDKTETFNGKTFDKIVTVEHIDESINVPLTNPSSFASRTFSVDKFAPKVGLIYQEHVLWEYQPNPNGTPYRIGFGVRRTILEHN